MTYNEYHETDLSDIGLKHCLFALLISSKDEIIQY